MRVVLAFLIGLMALTCCVLRSSAEGVRGDSAELVDFDEEDDDLFDEDEALFERRLLKLQKRCPYPGEVDDDDVCDEMLLYKPNKWCKKYCFVCPCWDLETYYDWKGNEIDDICTEDYCGDKDPSLPCSKQKNKDNEDCCDCFKCKYVEIMPWDHELCRQYIPQLTCEDITPEKDDDGEYFCDFDCPGDGVCVPDRTGKHCSCQEPPKECEDVKPEIDKYGNYFCDFDCPGDAECVPGRLGRNCRCQPPKECWDVKPEIDKHGDLFCPADCPEEDGECVPDSKGKNCICREPAPKECEDVTPERDGNGDYFCRADCPEEDGDCVAVKGRNGKYFCECKPECEDATPQDDCDGWCPDDSSGESCVRDGEGGCTCELTCEQSSPEDGCDGTCPFAGTPCEEVNGKCTCIIPCDKRRPDDDGTCSGFCPDDDTICAPDGTGGCECLPPCEDVEPDRFGNCPGFCPDDDGICAPDGRGGCDCLPLCEDVEPDRFGNCPGLCPDDEDGICVPDGRGGCECLPPCEDVEPDDAGNCPGFCPDGDDICAPDGRGGCDCLPPCEDVEPDDDGNCPGFCPDDEDGICVPDGEGGCDCLTPCEDVVPDDDGNCPGFCPEGEGICSPVDDDTCGCGVPIPVCTIEVDKRCIVPTRPTPSGGDCDGKVTQLTLIWTGNSPVNVGGQQVDKTTVQPGEALTISFGSSGGNDRELQLSGGGFSGVSVFHVSCSDKDMDGPEDCGKLQGNGKKNGGGINLWALEALVSSQGGGFNCGTLDVGAEGGQDNCELITRGGASCDTGKPDTITFLFNGGTDPSNQCLSSTINKVPNRKGKFHEDFECSGQVNPSEAVRVDLDKGGSVAVGPGEQFTVDLKAIKEMRLSNGGGTQNMEFHTSCSQPIAAGLTAGALTIVALDDQFVSSSVRYEYVVTNTGEDPVEVTSIEDNVIGTIVNIDPDVPPILAPNESRVFEATYNVPIGASSVTNVVEVVANSVGSDESCRAEDSVTVRITQLPPIGGSGSRRRRRRRL